MCITAGEIWIIYSCKAWIYIIKHTGFLKETIEGCHYYIIDIICENSGIRNLSNLHLQINGNRSWKNICYDHEINKIRYSF